MLKPVNMTERQKAGQALLKFLARVHAKQPPSTLSPQEQEEAIAQEVKVFRKQQCRAERRV